MSTHTTNKRHFSRIQFDAFVKVTSEFGDWDTQLIDISLKGVLLIKPNNWTGGVGTVCSITIRLNESDVEISMDAKVAHIEKSHIGYSCEHIGIESITHLRKLIELNLGNMDLLNRELTELVSG